MKIESLTREELIKYCKALEDINISLYRSNKLLRDFIFTEKKAWKIIKDKVIDGEIILDESLKNIFLADNNFGKRCDDILKKSEE
ncbi:MAG: hypothetical protein ACFFG0_35150 [Candidatus Thorarchaeota archaeon]